MSVIYNQFVNEHRAAIIADKKKQPKTHVMFTHALKP